MRLIDADAIKLKKGFFEKVDNVPKFYEWLGEQPTVDAVPVKVIEQFKWERDTAIQQLEEHGIPFCGKADVVPVVRCKECKHRPKHDGPNRLIFPDEICPCQCDDWYYNWMPSDDWFCADGERKE